MPRSDYLWHLERCAQGFLVRTKSLEEQKNPRIIAVHGALNSGHGERISVVSVPTDQAPGSTQSHEVRRADSLGLVPRK